MIRRVTGPVHNPDPHHATATISFSALHSSMEQAGSGYYIIDVYSLKQVSKRPSHLERRFLRLNPPSNTLEHAEHNRKKLLEAKRQKLCQKFVDIQKVVSEVKARKERRRLHMQQSLELAELKRKHHLEQRRTTSKEQVNRAKVIATQHMRHCEAEQERQRTALENRLAKSQARRLNMLGLPKSRILSSNALSGTSKKATTAAPGGLKPATSLINKSLKTKPCVNVSRSAKTAAVLAAFKGLDLPASSSPNTWPQFSQLVKILRKTKVIQTTAKTLIIALNLNDRSVKKRTRIFLSIYMMLTCPAEVFQDPEGSTEQQLISAAKQTLQAFEIWLDAHGKQVGSTTRLTFEECWNSYHALFESWQAKDRKQLVTNTTQYYLELIRLKHTLGAQGELDGVADQLTRQADQVKAHVQRLGGDLAVDQLLAAEKALQLDELANENLSIPPSPTPRPEKVRQEPDISPEQLTRLLSGYATSALSNESLAHEIIIDPEFKLQNLKPQNELTDLESRVRSIATRAFFDKVKEDFEAGHIESVMPILNDIRERLLSMVRPGLQIHEDISDSLDIELFEKQAKNKTFNLTETLNNIINIMLTLCAPVRDSEIREISQLDDKVQQARCILDILNEMSLDLANFRLRALRPHLIPIAVDYERSQFAEALSKGTVGLAKTRLWLRKATLQLHDTAARSSPEDNDRPKPNASIIYEKAVASLLISPEPVSFAMVPETWLLDVERLARDQNELQAITMVAALVLLAKNFGASGDMNALAARFFIMIEDKNTSIDHLANEIERNVKTTGAERRMMIRNMVDRTLKHSDTVYSLLARRVESVVRTHLQTGQFVSKAILTSYSLGHVQKPLFSLCGHLYTLVQHNRSVYARWYDEIIADEQSKPIPE